MEREYNCPCVMGKPKVAFRETITSPVPYVLIVFVLTRTHIQARTKYFVIVNSLFKLK